ncbi:YbaL family putative K(+) efflux transporter [Aeromonas rivipollensis]|uniref:YbaL family putative K(+) efflux transporter n=1 Tax=Aeromonas rivipollensis TaxID=948519 RepID=UPI0027D94581|nr:YbaL family putative K(+) efflux transporter [uncultured Aeromonas sp.]MDU1142244.1 YbaL family putative K(+) efflux transporter [Aeromonas hydrophila]
MDHSLPLITTLVGGFVLAYLFGMLAQRLRISPMVGYLAAGVVCGPFTPGYVADLRLAPELAEIGVILLMFGVGLHFSLKDLLSVKHIAIPGAIVQITLATLLGLGLSQLLGWSITAGLVFGLALSTASTVVLLRALESRGQLDTKEGRIAIGWLIVEDLVMVLALVLLPILANLQTGGEALTLAHVLRDLGFTLAKVAAFIALMTIGGRRLIPWMLARTAATGSRELFTLAVLSCSLGIAFGAVKLFGVSFALGAFFAGVVMNSSHLSHKAANDTLPLQDAFAVLFFVSVGMLFDPTILLREPLAVLATLFVIVIGKSVAAFAIVRLFGHSLRTALTISASLAQVGEFSFILMGLGAMLGLVPDVARDLVLVGACFSIMLNPLVFNQVERWLRSKPEPRIETDTSLCPLQGHVVVVGADAIGSHLIRQLHEQGREMVVIDPDEQLLEPWRAQGITCLTGHPIQNDLLSVALPDASWLLITLDDSLLAGEIAARAREQGDLLRIAACGHQAEEVHHLLIRGAHQVVQSEEEAARRLCQLATHAS